MKKFSYLVHVISWNKKNSKKYIFLFSSFASLIFTKISQQMAHTCADVSVFFEAFLFHEITWTKYYFIK